MISCDVDVAASRSRMLCCMLRPPCLTSLVPVSVEVVASATSSCDAIVALMPGVLAVGQHGPLMLSQVLAEDPAFSRASAVEEGLVRRAHACARGGASIITGDVGEVIRFGNEATIDGVGDIITAGKAVQ